MVKEQPLSIRVETPLGYNRSESVPQFTKSNPRSLRMKDNKRVLTLHRSLKPFAFEVSRMGEALEALSLYSGRHPSVTSARKGVAAFGIRAGALCGARVTLRG